MKLDKVPWNLTWVHLHQSNWVGLTGMKTERAQIHHWQARIKAAVLGISKCVRALTCF